MSCEEFKQSIDTYLEGELPQKTLSEFEAHLKSCQHCQMELMSFDKCVKLMRKFMKDSNPPAAIRKNLFEKLGCCDMTRMSGFKPNSRQ